MAPGDRVHHDVTVEVPCQDHRPAGGERFADRHRAPERGAVPLLTGPSFGWNCRLITGWIPSPTSVDGDLRPSIAGCLTSCFAPDALPMLRAEHQLRGGDARAQQIVKQTQLAQLAARPQSPAAVIRSTCAPKTPSKRIRPVEVVEHKHEPPPARQCQDQVAQCQVGLPAGLFWANTRHRRPRGAELDQQQVGDQARFGSSRRPGFRPVRPSPAAAPPD
jgi:hypothetical protein